MFIVQVLGPSRRRSGHCIDVTVVIELASRIYDLPQNESGELLAYGVDPISRVTFIPHLRHLFGILTMRIRSASARIPL